MINRVLLILICIFSNLINTSFARPATTPSATPTPSTVSAAVCSTVGESLRIDSAGGSLATFRPQDQDGIGSCYANVASLMLQSTLPNHPEVSFLQIAITSSDNFIGRGQAQRLSATGELESYLENGWICSTLDNLNARGGYCTRENFDLERMIYNGDVPVSSLRGTVDLLGGFYDSISPSAGQSTLVVLDKIRTLRNIVTRVRARAEEQCARTAAQGGTDEGLRGLIEWYFLNDFARTSNLFNNNYVKVERPQRPNYVGEVTVRLTAKFEQDIVPAYRRILAGQSNPVVVDNFTTQVADMLQSFGLPRNISWKMSNDQFRNTLRSDLLSIDQNYCRTQNLREGITDEYLDVRNACVRGSLDYLNVILGSDTLGNSVEQIQRILDRASGSLRSYFTGVLGPACTNNLVALPSKFMCNTYNMSGRSTDDAQDFRNIKNDFRRRTAEQLRRGRAVGIGVCTDFLQNPNSNTQYARDDLCPPGPNAMHALAVIGYRCGANGIEYLMQNSWGVGCSYGPHIGCSTDDAQKGQFWVGEDLLIRNTREYNTISL